MTPLAPATKIRTGPAYAVPGHLLGSRRGARACRAAPGQPLPGVRAAVALVPA